MTKFRRMILFILWSFLLFGCKNGFLNDFNKNEENSDSEIIDVYLSSDGFYYSRNGDNITINGIEESNSLIRLIIPEEINGRKVTEIGEQAFYKNQRIKEVVLPETIEVLNYEAFSGCKQLSKINLPESLKIINNAFSACLGLSSVIIPSSLIDGRGAFNYCTNITKVEFVEGAKYVPSFESCYNLTEIELPETIKEIADNAFKYTGLKEIKIPSKLEIMGADCFYGTEIETLEIPAEMTSVPDNFFSGSIKEAVIPSHVKKLGQYLFRYCEGLERVIINCDLPASIVGETDNNYNFSPFEKLLGDINNDRQEITNIEIIFGPEVKTVATRFDIIPSKIDFGNVEELGNGVFQLGTAEEPLETYTIPASIKRIGSGNRIYAKNYIFDHDFEYGDFPYVSIYTQYGSLIDNPTVTTFVETKKEWDSYYESWYYTDVYETEYLDISITFEEGVTFISDDLFGMSTYYNSDSLEIVENYELDKKQGKILVKEINLPSTLNKPVIISGCYFTDLSWFKKEKKVPLSFINCSIPEKIIFDETYNERSFINCVFPDIDIIKDCKNVNFTSCKFLESNITNNCENISFASCKFNDVEINSYLNNQNTLFENCAFDDVKINEGGTLSKIFDNCKIGSLSFSDEVTHVDELFATDCLFENDIYLNKILYIGTSGFFHTRGNICIKFGDYTTKICSRAFSLCTDISFEFTNPISLDKDSSLAFFNCNKLVISPRIEGDNVKLPDRFYMYCINLKTIDMTGVKEFNASAIINCPSLEDFICDDNFEYKDGQLRSILHYKGVNDEDIVSKTIQYCNPKFCPEVVVIPEDVRNIGENAFDGCKISKLIFENVCFIGENAFNNTGIYELITHGDTTWEVSSSYNENLGSVKILRIYPEIISETYKNDTDYSNQYFLPQGYNRPSFGSHVLNLVPEEIHYYLYEKQEVTPEWYIGYMESRTHTISSKSTIYIHCYDASENPDATYEQQKAFYENPNNQISKYKSQFIYVLADGTEIPYSAE